MTARHRSIHGLEVSELSALTFEELGLETIGDLSDTTTVDFLLAAYR